MKNLLPLALASTLVLSCVLFDSDFIKEIPALDPYAYFFLAGLSCFLLYLINSGRLCLNRSVATCVGALFLIVVYGLFSSLLSGGSDIYAAGSKILTLFFVASFLVLGHNIDSTSDNARVLGRMFLITSTLVVVFVTMLGLDTFNNNWLAITLLFSVMVFSIINKVRCGVLAIALILVSFYSFMFLQSRGVSLASGTSALLVLCGRLNFSLTKYVIVQRTILYAMTLVGAATSIFGVMLYNNRLYQQISSESIKYTGKNLDSGRLERWSMAFELFKEKPLWGWGIDSHIARASSAVDLGNIHSFWLEAAFRLGLVGVALYLFTYFIVSNEISKNSNNMQAIALYSALVILSSVYALGGFTHWPGTFLFWFTIGLMMNRTNGIPTFKNKCYGESL